MLRSYSGFAVFMGRTESSIAAARRAVMLDPLNRTSHATLGQALYFGRQSQEAIAAFQDALSLDPEYTEAYAFRGLAYYARGDFGRARASCESKPDFWRSQLCLAVTYDKLGQHVDAEAQLAKMKAIAGDDAAYQYAGIHAQWGDTGAAVQWLDTAMRLRDPGLEQLKTDPLLDPLRKDSRFQAIEQELNFPQ